MNSLLEAYKGFYEVEIEREHRPTYVKYVQTNEDLAVEAFDSWVDSLVKTRIKQDSARTRLEVYLEWNGIHGYTSQIYSIATGELV